MRKYIVTVGAALLALAPAAARADYHVVSPYEIDLGELEIEHNGDAVFDRRPSQKGATSYTTEFGTGLTPWWHSEIELGFDRAPGGGKKVGGIEWRDVFAGHTATSLWAVCIGRLLPPGMRSLL